MTKFGWLLRECADGSVPTPEEFQSGQVLTCEMVFRGKMGTGDYHDNMDGAMFDKWITERLFPTFESVFPGKKMILVMDNAPYHHCFSDDCFFAKDKNKDEIAEKLREFGLTEFTVEPFALDDVQWRDAPAVDVQPREYAGWVMYDKTDGAMWLIDGLTDEGYGDAIVYTRICRRKFGAVESTLVDDFKRLVHEGEYVLVGYGEHAVRFCRQSGIMNARNVVVKRNRNTRRIRTECKRFFASVKRTSYTYDIDDINKTYNGGGGKGTGGPKGEWLVHAVDEYIKVHHPHLRETKVMRMFREKGWQIIFTVPYWAKSQPIELAWAYVKNYVGRKYFPGRGSKDLRRHILEGMYGSGDRKHSGLDGDLANKLILKTHKYINEFVLSQDELNGRGLVGDFSDVVM